MFYQMFNVISRHKRSYIMIALNNKYRIKKPIKYRKLKYVFLTIYNKDTSYKAKYYQNIF